MNKEEKKAVQDSKNIINELNNHKDKDFIGRMYYKNKPIEEILEILLNLIEKLQKENEELKISNKEIDKECSRLEKKEVELINENEHYEDLIYALKTYYGITEEDLEKCMKNDR